MPLTDAENLDKLRLWRDNVVAALEAPESPSAFGGAPDAGGPLSLKRMGGRAQLLSELEWLDKRISELENAEAFLRESRGAY